MIRHSMERKTGALSDAERMARLDAEVSRWVGLGYRVQARTPTTAQLVKPKSFSFLWALLWFLVFGVGVLVYLFYYAAKRDSSVYLTVDDGGAVVGQASGAVPRLPSSPVALSASGRLICPACGHPNSSRRQSCKVCRLELGLTAT